MIADLPDGLRESGAIEVREKLGTISGGDVIDVGTEEGDFINTLMKTLKEYNSFVGIDIAADGLEKAREQFKDAPVDLMEITHQLSGTMIYLGGETDSIEQGVSISKDMIQSGKAYQKFLEIVKEQNGDVSYIESPEKYTKPKFITEIKADRSGFIQSIDALEVGLTSVSLGAGRLKSDDIIEPETGIILHKKIGDKIAAGEPIFTIHTNKSHITEQAKVRLLKAIRISENAVKKEQLIFEKLDKNSL